MFLEMSAKEDSEVGELNVVFIDDEPDLLRIAKILLERHKGMHIAPFESANQALEHLRSQTVDAIVCDYMMPDMDGLEFLSQVRREFGDIPFILFTGRGQEETVIQAMERAADFYVRKDSEAGRQFDEMYAKIVRAVKARRKRAAELESESLLAETQKVLGAGSFSVDIPKGQVRLSRPLVDLVGASVHDVQGARTMIAERIYLPDQERLVQILRAMMAGEADQTELEIRVLAASGEMRTVIVRVSAGRQPSGKVTNLIGIVQDVTDRRRQEERLQAALEMVSDAVVLVDREGFVRFLNPRAIDLFMLDPEESRGKTLKEILPRMWRAAQEHVLDAGRYDIFELDLEDDEESVLQIAVEPVRAGQLWIARDVSKERHQERILEESELQYTRIMRNVHEGICCINNDGTITYCNESFMKMLSLGEEDVVGHSIIAFMRDADLEGLLESEDEPQTIKFRTTKGKSFQGQVRSLTIMDEEENPTGAILFII
jgi:PAS domain S-box-containing protein